MSNRFPFYEFFAGGGLARIGLGSGWNCLFANDISEIKARTYRSNFPPARELLVQDIDRVSARDIPGQATLAWASFPCQDLSLAGSGRGLRAERSGAFWPFWNLMTALEKESRAVPIIVLENVVGLLTSNEGRDFRQLIKVLTGSGYRAGAVVIDAVHFVPQSRPRLFIIAARDELRIPQELLSSEPRGLWFPSPLINAFSFLSPKLKENWLWWDLRTPRPRRTEIREIIEDVPSGIGWHSREQTERILNLMSPKNLEKVHQASASKEIQVGTLYKRTRSQNGRREQRAEVRFDGISGCLRTPTGGSSRQTILIVDGDRVRSRLLSVREAARLMGLPDSYKLPDRYNDGYHVMGDAVAVPVISWLEEHLLRPLATAGRENPF